MVTTDESGTGRIWRTDKDLQIVRFDDAEWEDVQDAKTGVDSALTQILTLAAKVDNLQQRSDAQLIIRDLRTGQARTCPAGTDIAHVALSENGELVALSGSKEEVLVVSTRDCSVRATIKEAAQRYARDIECRFAGRGMLLTFRWGEARLWDITHPSAPVRLFRVPKASAHMIDGLVVFESAGLIAGTGKSPSGRWKTTAWSLNDGAALWTIDASSIARSPDGATFAAADGRAVNIHETHTGKMLGSYREHRASVTHVAYSADGNRVVSCSNDRTARVWSPSTRAPGIVLEGHQFPVTTAVFSARGGRVVTVSNRTLRLWDAKRGTLLAILDGHAQAVRSVEFVNGDRLLLSVARSEVIEWDTAVETRTPREIDDWLDRQAHPRLATASVAAKQGILPIRN